MKATDIQLHEIVPTPIPALNQILGGGFPSRIIIEVAGPPSSGKSSLALQFIAQAQRLGRPCYYADAERAIDFVRFAEKIGVDCNTLEYDKQDYAEMLLDRLIAWLDGGEFEKEKFKAHKNAVVVIDAIGALHGRDEAEKTMEGKSWAVQAKMIAKFCRQLAPIIDRQNTVLILVNHIYEVMNSNTPMKLYKSSGGEKLKYHCGLSLWLKEGGAPKRNADGTKMVKIINAEIKNKAKYSDAFEGTKVELELIPKDGFVGEFVQAPAKKKTGRPKLTNT